MVIEPDIGRCANEDVDPRGWIVKSHIGGEQNIPYKGVERTLASQEEWIGRFYIG